MADQSGTTSRVEDIWYEVIVHGHRSRLASLPGSPRCIVCQVPFAGVGSPVARLTGRRRSRKSSNMCNICDDNLPQGGAEVEIAVLFADVRGSTALGERMGADAFAGLLNRFYRAATKALMANNAMIDKMIGDEVMALFFPAAAGQDPAYRVAAVRAAEDLMRGVGYGGRAEAWLPVGIAVHVGLAYVGKVGAEGVSDVTAIGDTVNTAARLQAQAAPGEILLSDAAYAAVADGYPSLEERTLSLRGRNEPIHVRVLSASALQTS